MVRIQIPEWLKKFRIGSEWISIRNFRSNRWIDVPLWIEQVSVTILKLRWISRLKEHRRVDLGFRGKEKVNIRERDEARRRPSEPTKRRLSYSIPSQDEDLKTGSRMPGYSGFIQRERNPPWKIQVILIRATDFFTQISPLTKTDFHFFRTLIEESALDYRILKSLKGSNRLKYLHYRHFFSNPPAFTKNEISIWNLRNLNKRH